MNNQVFHIGIKGLIRDKKGEFLLLKLHPDKLIVKGSNPWDIPGGRMRSGEEFTTTLAREIKEKLGVTYGSKPDFFTSALTNLHIPTDRGKVDLVLMFYFVTIPDDTKIILSDEHTGYEWVDVETTIERLRGKYTDRFADQLSTYVNLRHYKKLVRDNIPDIIRSEGKQPRTRILDDQEEYLRELVNKLGEETSEFSVDPSVEELADIQEVVNSLRGAIGKTTEELEAARSLKSKSRGVFLKKIYLEGVN